VSNGENSARALAWEDVHPRYVVRPDWVEAGVSWRTPWGLAMLWAVGLIGALVAAKLQLAVNGPAGYENTIDDQLNRFSAAEQILFVVGIAPLVEEIVYRLPLVGRVRLPALGLAGLGAALLIADATLVVAALFGTVGLSALAAWANPPTRERVEAWWHANPRWPVWAFALAFGLVHLVNYDIDWSVVAVLAAPIVVAPQIWLGLMFTIARVRYAWWAGLTLHAAHNMTVWSLASLA